MSVDKRTSVLIVGYKTKLDVPIEAIETPTYDPPSNYKDEEKIATWQKTQQGKFHAQCASLPYYSTFERVVIADPVHELIQGFNWYPPEKNKPPLCLRVHNWLLKHYPAAWPNDINTGQRKPEAIFLGFNPRAFLKLLGIECSMPAIGKPLPSSLWFDNRDHRDVGEAVLPEEYAKLIPFSHVLKSRGITPKEGWVGPGQDAEEDVRISVELATQLGFLDGFPVPVALAQATGKL